MNANNLQQFTSYPHCHLKGRIIQLPGDNDVRDRTAWLQQKSPYPDPPDHPSFRRVSSPMRRMVHSDTEWLDARGDIRGATEQSLRASSEENIPSPPDLGVKPTQQLTAVSSPTPTRAGPV